MRLKISHLHTDRTASPPSPVTKPFSCAGSLTLLSRLFPYQISTLNLQLDDGVQPEPRLRAVTNASSLAPAGHSLTTRTHVLSNATTHMMLIALLDLMPQGTQTLVIDYSAITVKLRLAMLAWTTSFDLE